MKPVNVNFVCALDCEAKPIVDYFGLKQLSKKGEFKIYTTQEIMLIVTGIGKVAAAAGTGVLGVFAKNEMFSVWLNVGIAGHPSRFVGEGVISHKIVDGQTKQSWYPPLVFEPTVETDSLTTWDHPVFSYKDSGMVDMEGAGFYPTALRFSTAELVHCFKVVSDNGNNPPYPMKPSVVTDLIKENLKPFEETMIRLKNLGTLGSPLKLNDSRVKKYENHWHFSAYQKNRLNRLWQRVQVLGMEKTIKDQEVKHFKTSEQFLCFLEERVRKNPVQIGKI